MPTLDEYLRLEELCLRLCASMDKLTGDPAETDRLAKIHPDDRLFLSRMRGTSPAFSE